ncbi:MAG: hypothetical protein U0176_18895 [Bacteroidia bacterium]
MITRRFVLMLTVLLTMGGLAYGQKGKLKGETAQDSAAAAQARASEANQAVRDSLRSQISMPATAAVDTFAPAPKTDPAFSYVQAQDFADARKRIAQAEEDLAKAAAALVRASQSGQYTDEQLEKAAERIRLQTESLETIKKRIAAVEKDWKVVKRIPEEPVKPESNPKAVPASGGSKGKLTGGATSPSPGVQPAGGKPKLK